LPLNRAGFPRLKRFDQRAFLALFSPETGLFFLFLSPDREQSSPFCAVEAPILLSLLQPQTG